MGAEIVLKTEGLTRIYGSTPAVDNLTIEVHKGDIYGLVGLPGAGKTTCLQLLLGLVRPTSGSIRFFGRDFADDPLDTLSRVGAMVGAPAFYPFLTARENLKLLARLRGVGRERLQKVLEWADLDERAGEKVATYTPRLRQKLGIAAALVGRPQLALLDEPTAGLNPQGVDEMRGLIRRLAAGHGVTFVITSHKLADIEALCNRVGIIHCGRLVVEGETREVLETGRVRLHVKVDRADSALNLLEEENIVEDPIVRETDGFRVQVKKDRINEVARLLVSSGYRVHGLVPRRPTLEEYFMHTLPVL